MNAVSRRAAATLCLALASALLGAGPVAACSVCYGDSANASPLITSAKLGVFLLLGVTVCLLAAFAKFFFYLRNRARQAESESIAAEWAQLQRSASS